MAQKKCPLMSKPGESLAKPSIAKTKEFCKECAFVEEEWHLKDLLTDIEIAKSILAISDNFTPDNMAQFDDYKKYLREQYDQLDDQKRKELSDEEKCYLFLLLFGMDTEGISKRFFINNVTPTLSKTIYRYVWILTRKKINNWAQVRLYLEKHKYRFALISDSLGQTPVYPNLKVLGIKNKEEVEQILSQLINALTKE